MRIAITGATGFLGSNLCVRAREEGHEVVSALGTKPVEGDRLAMAGFPFFRADLSDVDAMADAFGAAEIVVHCAAKSAPWGRRRDFEEANVAGTANVVSACRRAGIRRLVHVSSASVYFELADRLGIREDTVLPPPANEYARSKALAEAEARHFEGDVVVLRPRGIFGPGDPTLVPRLAKAVRQGHLPLFRGGRAMVDVTYVDAVSSAILAAATVPGAIRATYNVAHGEPVQIRALIERVLCAMGVRFSWRPRPLFAALALSKLEQIASFMRIGGEPTFTPYTVGLVAFSHTLDVSAT